MHCDVHAAFPRTLIERGSGQAGDVLAFQREVLNVAQRQTAAGDGAPASAAPERSRGCSVVERPRHVEAILHRLVIHPDAALDAGCSTPRRREASSFVDMHERHTVTSGRDNIHLGCRTFGERFDRFDHTQLQVRRGECDALEVEHL